MNTCTSRWKKTLAARGLACISRSTSSPLSPTSTEAVSAWMVAERGARSNRLISPKKSPGPMRERTCSTRPVTGLETTMVPERTRNISEPTSPSRNSTSPARSRFSRSHGHSACRSGSETSWKRTTVRRKEMSAALAIARYVAHRFISAACRARLRSLSLCVPVRAIACMIAARSSASRS